MSGRAVVRALAVAIMVFTTSADAQVKGAQPIRPAARDADVTTVDSIVTALYASISGPVGAPRQWERLLSLFHPEGRLIPAACAAEGRCMARASTPEEYRTAADVFMVYEGFREREVARRTTRFGNVAQVWSTYEAFRRSAQAPFIRGVNAITLTWDGRRWWIISVASDEERPGLTLPAEYLATPRTS